MSSAVRALGLCLLASLLGCGISLKTVDIDPDQTRWLQVPETASHYSRCLELLGPPTFIERTAAGFDFHYQSYASLKYKGEASYFYSKLAYAGGDADITAIVLRFDQQGSLLAQEHDLHEVDSGWGGVVGHSRTPELYFRAEQYLYESPVSADLTLERSRD